ncbi:MAG: 50S ribosomal protein L6 [Phycisphaerae bacterium]|nr:50S ribosomal protein L6 [Phycisphaerae bacterium]
MSRIGNKPVPVPSGVTVKVAGASVSVKGPKGELATAVPQGVSVAFDEAKRVLVVTRASDAKKHKALHGLVRALLANNVHGVTVGYTKGLEIVGVGYNARVQGNKLLLTVGFANVVERVIPVGVKVELPQPTKIVISGPDKQAVGHFATDVRKVRPPEPYKGKGIRFDGEVVRRKPGKAFAGGAPA